MAIQLEQSPVRLIKKSPLSFTSNCKSLELLSKAAQENISAKSEVQTNYLPGRFAMGTPVQPDNLASEVNIDPRLLAIYHIKNITKADNISIPEHVDIQSLSRLQGITKPFVESGVRKMILSDKAVDARGNKRFGGDWIKEANMYNLLVRGDTAWDADHNGKIELKNSQGVNESGTFVKALDLLPHLAKMKVNTIYLNPVNSIGEMGRKGTAGSPYAIRDFYELNADLDDPQLKTSTNDEFKAFVDASHKNNMRVMIDFVFRLAAYDNALLVDKPEWLRWRHENAPAKSSDDGQIPSRQQMEDAMAAAYQKKFGHQPEKKLVVRDIKSSTDTSLNVKKDDGTQTWKDAGLYPREILEALREIHHKAPTQAGPPDQNDPQVWSDVTFLRVGRHDPKIPELWDYIENVIPFYQKTFGIDAARIDMAHDLNQELFERILKKARENDPDFSYFAEDFCGNYDCFWSGDGRKVPENQKFNAACGNIHYAPTENTNINGTDLKNAEMGYVNDWAFNKARWSDGVVWGTPETHDSGRAAINTGGTLYSKGAYTRHSFFPKLFPTIIGGFELGESKSKKADNQPSELFDYSGLQSWLNPDEANGASTVYEQDGKRISDRNIVDYMGKVSEIRNKYLDVITDPHSDSYLPMDTGGSPIMAFARIPMTRHKDGSISNKALLFVQNADAYNQQGTALNKGQVQYMLRRFLEAQGKKVDTPDNIKFKIKDELTGQVYERNSSEELGVVLKRGQSQIFSLTVEK